MYPIVHNENYHQATSQPNVDLNVNIFQHGKSYQCDRDALRNVFWNKRLILKLNQTIHKHLSFTCVTLITK